MTWSEFKVSVGDVLAGKYAVERVLGRGGMGVVLAVRHLMLDERRALKLMLPTTAEGTQAVDRFFREARAAARLRSEHVTKVHDVGLLPGGMPFIEMEFLEGLDLAGVLAQRAALPVSEVLVWLGQVCEALEEAHKAGIVHRDLKPANLFLTKRPNGTDCVKVLDFGIAKLQGHQDKSLTTTGATLGSPLYMSPEQMYGASYADARSDIWSLGVVMFQLLTGKVPFSADSVTALALMVVNEPAPLPGSSRRDIPPDLETIVVRCLEKQPVRRFQSAGELGAALSSVRANREMPAAWPHTLASGTAQAVRLNDSGEGRSPSNQASESLPSAQEAPSTVGPGLTPNTIDAPLSATMGPPQRTRSAWLPVAIGLTVLGALSTGVLLFGNRGSAKTSPLAASPGPEPDASFIVDPSVGATPSAASSEGGAIAVASAAPVVTASTSARPAPPAAPVARTPPKPPNPAPTATNTSPKVSQPGFGGVD